MSTRSGVSPRKRSSAVTILLLVPPSADRRCGMVLQSGNGEAEDKVEAGAGEGNRTLVWSLGSSRSAIELHPRGPESLPSPRPVSSLGVAAVHAILAQADALTSLNGQRSLPLSHMVNVEGVLQRSWRLGIPEAAVFRLACRKADCHKAAGEAGMPESQHIIEEESEKKFRAPLSCP